jgi:uncharacterized membrane protein (DUF485 family)
LSFNALFVKPSNVNSSKTDLHSEAFLDSLMRKQLRLSITCAAAFLIVLLGLPLANYFFPELMAKRIFGFTLTWFVLGIGFFPVVWCIAFYFIRHSIKLEDDEVEEVSREAAKEKS